MAEKYPINFQNGVPGCCCCRDIFIDLEAGETSMYRFHSDDPNTWIQQKTLFDYTPKSGTEVGSDFDHKNKKVYFALSSLPNPYRGRLIRKEINETSPPTRDGTLVFGSLTHSFQKVCVDWRNNRLFFAESEFGVNNPKISRVDMGGGDYAVVHTFLISVVNTIRSIRHCSLLDRVYYTCLNADGNSSLGYVDVTTGANTILLTKTTHVLDTVDVDSFRNEIYWMEEAKTGLVCTLYRADASAGAPLALVTNSVTIRNRYSHSHDRIYYTICPRVPPRTFSLNRIDRFGGNQELLFQRVKTSDGFGSAEIQDIRLGCGFEATGDNAKS